MLMGGKVLIESTCNQVNQFGGYTGMTPADFVRFVHDKAAENKFPLDNIILGGDHLGPNVWQNEPAEMAMQKSRAMIRDYIQAGFQKIHLDCSMRLGDDPAGPLDPDISAKRATSLAKMAEASRIDAYPAPLFVIGTEVPVPGGATEHEEGVRITNSGDVKQTIDITHRAFIKEGLESAWERVIAVVVQPGVEFGDDFVLKYDPQKTRSLSSFIESQAMVFEAHSTDYQIQEALKYLVRDHFAILKVGPEFTFEYRETIFTLAMVENELFPEEQRSNIIQVLDEVMDQSPRHWQNYIRGTPEQISFARKYGLSDRIRYYWMYPRVQAAMDKMIKNLHEKALPLTLLKQSSPKQFELIGDNKTCLIPEELITLNIQKVLQKYQGACSPK
jgi:D-tagatose-1,6-bisphosphate aldolase subunit GatZ/KbaZ